MIATAPISAMQIAVRMPIRLRRCMSFGPCFGATGGKHHGHVRLISAVECVLQHDLKVIHHAHDSRLLADARGEMRDNQIYVVRDRLCGLIGVCHLQSYYVSPGRLSYCRSSRS